MINARARPKVPPLANPRFQPKNKPAKAQPTPIAQSISGDIVRLSSPMHQESKASSVWMKKPISLAGEALDANAKPVLTMAEPKRSSKGSENRHCSRSCA